jgi:hypothetical protein
MSRSSQKITDRLTPEQITVSEIAGAGQTT